MKQLVGDTTAFQQVNSAGLPIPPALPDSLMNDSIVEPVYAIVMENPMVDEPRPQEDPESLGISLVWVVLVGLFCAVALKFKNNFRYLRAIVSDLTDVRTRQNAFDETVKESSFLVLLNVLWVCCCGVLLWKAIMLTSGGAIPEYSFTIPDSPSLGIAICSATMGAYAIMMSIAYWMIGFVFADREKAGLWLKGAWASQGLEVVLLLPIAALALCYSPWVTILLEIAAGVVILGKIIFIYKGFRIFFTQISSWLLFLYYLCSVEIVPLILTYLATLQLCSVLL